MAIATLAIAIVTGLAATRQNHQSLATQQIVVQFESNDAYQNLQGQARQMAYWQDAFNNINRRWDDQWVAYEFGPYQNSMGNHLVAILGPDRSLRLLHAADQERDITREAFAGAKGLGALLDAVRKTGVHQPPPIPQGIVVIGNRPYFAVAAIVTPESADDLAQARRHPFTALFFQRVTPAQYESLSTGFRAHDVQVSTEDRPRPGIVRIALNDAGGRPLAWLEWRPLHPGMAFLKSIALPLMIVLLSLTLIQWLVIRRWLVLQRRVFHAEAERSAADEQNRLKSVFLGTISHELRTPLNAIIGYSDVLCCELFGSLGSPRNVEYVRDIRDSGRRLLKTVNDLIEIARIEAHDTCKSDEWFDLAVSARQAVTAIEVAAKEKNITILLSAPKDEAWCKGSRLSLSHAIERLLGNAVRHSREGGRVDVVVEQTAEHATVTIRDYGEGIAKDRLADLARPFGHPDSHLIAPLSKGMGFGIPIAKGLVQLMGGRFTIDSEPDEGTTVRIQFPAQQAPSTQPSVSDYPPEPIPTGVIWSGRGRDFVARKAAASR